MKVTEGGGGGKQNVAIIKQHRSRNSFPPLTRYAFYLYSVRCTFSHLNPKNIPFKSDAAVQRDAAALRTEEQNPRRDEARFLLAEPERKDSSGTAV